MRRARALLLIAVASRALAQHEGHMMDAAGSAPPRFDFQASLIYADAGGLHGRRKVSVRDWEMFHSRGYISDHLKLMAMTSLGSLIPDSAGMPSLLQTGGAFENGSIWDHQHPEELIMEAAARLDVGKTFLYLAPIGAPALGPTAYLHRPSAVADPVAPLSHHWQDATHVSYGVLTAGARARGATAEVSAFNARESDVDEPWPDFSHGGLDSFSGRLGYQRSGVEVQAWWGYLKAHDVTAPEMQMHRYGSSLSFSRSRSSSLAVWGMNVHHHDGESHIFLHEDSNASPHTWSSSLLVESTVNVGAHGALFGRAERVMKSGEELGFQGGDLLALYDVRALSMGTRRDVAMMGSGRLALGIRGTVLFLPAALAPTYGGREELELHLFAQARRAP